MHQFCPTNPSEKDLMDHFAKLNIGAGKTFNFAKLSFESQKAVTDGIADAGTDMDALMKRVNADEVSSSEFFGTREFLKNNYLHRHAGAKLGLYGNSGEEAIYLAYFVDGTINRGTRRKPATRCSFPKASYRRLKPSGRSLCMMARPSSWWRTL